MKDIKISSKKYIYNLSDRYPLLEAVVPQIIDSVRLISQSVREGGKLIICGNGGSASDSEHIVGELMKGFISKRKVDPEVQSRLKKQFGDDGKVLAENLQGTIPAISLVNSIALQTAYSNDVNPSLVFAQQIYGIGKERDVLLAISTSGNSKNILFAAKLAKFLKISVIGLTGKYGGVLREYSDICIDVPEIETFKIQELHLPVYHAMCLALENEFYSLDD